MRASGIVGIAAVLLAAGYAGKKTMDNADLKAALAGDVPPADYQPPDKAAPYLGIFDSAAARYGVPRTLLLRVAQQESNFDPAAENPSGAAGMMQLMPQFYPGVDPFDPAQAIPAAAKSLREYHDRFGSWALALAAYNWGPGNLHNALAESAPLDAWPAETRNYVADITADTGIA